MMPETNYQKPLADAMKKRGIVYGDDEQAFAAGWLQFEQGNDLNIPLNYGPVRRGYFEGGYKDAAGTPGPAPMDARWYFAAAALQGLCASQGAKVLLDPKVVAENCWRIADAMLAAKDEKDRRAAT